MKLVKTGIAGTMESGDIMVEIEPRGGTGVDVELTSNVSNQFGGQIKRMIEQTLAENGVDGVNVKAVDKGALDCTIRARVTAAALRGAEQTEYDWK